MFRFEMGPRARRNMRKGFHPALLIPLLPFLVLGGWGILAVAAALLGAGFMTVTAAFGIIARIIGRLFTHAVTSSSVAVGTVIGLVWYFTNKRRKEAAEAEEKEERKEAEPAAEEIIETTHYMFH